MRDAIEAGEEAQEPELPELHNPGNRLFRH